MEALWAFSNAFKTPIGCTPYKLVYGKSCHLPIELEHKAYWALKHANFDLKTAGDHQKLQLNELRDQAYENSLIYKERTKKLHDSKIKNRIFNVGDRVLLFNSRLKIFSGKLKTRWSGPFTITKVFPYGTIELSQPDGPNFKVNGHRVKHYFGGDLPPKIRVLSYELAKLDVIKLSHWSSRDKGMARGVKETHKEWKFYTKSFAKEAQCMRTRNSNFLNNSNVTIPRRRNRGRAPNIVEPELRTTIEVAPMAERTMEELLRAPTEGYGEAIILPEINADHFEIKTNLLQLVQANPFHGYERENPHAHINSFKRITSTLRFRDVPNDVIKLMMFPYSLEGNARLSTRKNHLIRS
ncbi:hypothetical protein Tco_0981033 [Tanacetum coccineum]